MLTAPESQVAGVVVLGDKAKTQISRTHRNEIQLSFNQIGKDIPTFAEASAAADTILTSGIKFDSASIVFNEFKSAIAYEATTIRNYSIEALKAAGTWFDSSSSLFKNIQMRTGC
jgi:F-type H+-transporting ATPase subunit gamma